MQNLLTIFTLLLAVNLVSPQDTSVATAIAGIIENFFLPRSITFNYIVYRCPHLDLVNEIAMLVKTPAKVIVLEPRNAISIDQSAILFFNDTPQFVEFYRYSTIAIEYPKELHFFVYIVDFRFKKFDHLSFDFLYANLLLKDANFVTHSNNDTIDLTTFTMFQHPRCRKVHPKTINRFSTASKKWKNQRFAIEKFRNFNGCKIRIFDSIFNDEEVFRIFEYSLNFTSKFISSRELLNESVQYDIHLSINFLRLNHVTEHNGKKFRWDTQTHHVSISHRVFVASRQAPYSFLEKALMPLDIEVWHCLVGVLVMAVLVIVVVSFANQKVKNFVFGSKVKVPLLNLV
jgi:hypothetical protein